MRASTIIVRLTCLIAGTLLVKLLTGCSVQTSIEPEAQALGAAASGELFGACSPYPTAAAVEGTGCNAADAACVKARWTGCNSTDLVCESGVCTFACAVPLYDIKYTETPTYQSSLDPTNQTRLSSAAYCSALGGSCTGAADTCVK